ncbi:MAG: glycoside hydrolase family 25 protein [Methylobacteriaceae bacterium]|jgi:lysozyme|nr:glycoside hydrolase family 25 protein [Methylobacteriaceae bacterium]
MSFHEVFTKGVLACCVLGLVAGLAGCSMAPQRSAPGDVKPHRGVAKARRMPVHGIDVSRYQGDIDWGRVRKAGTEFAYIKATEGGDHIDEKFYQNWHGARRAGVPRGAYHFMYWCRPAEEQADWFRKIVPQDPEALPPVLDLEWNHTSPSCPKGTTPENALAMAKEILAAMEEHTGKRPIIYTDITFHDDVLKGELRDYPFWIRSVAAEPYLRYGDRRWTMWQYTTTGHVPGIDTTVDRNVFYGNRDQWQAMLETHCDPRDIPHLSRIGLCVK